MPFFQDTQSGIDFRQQPCNCGFAGSGIAGKDHVQGSLRQGQPSLLPDRSNPEQVNQTFQLVFDVLQPYQLVQLCQQFVQRFRRSFCNFSIIDNRFFFSWNRRLFGIEIRRNDSRLFQFRTTTATHGGISITGKLLHHGVLHDLLLRLYFSGSIQRKLRSHLCNGFQPEQGNAALYAAALQIDTHQCRQQCQ